MKDPRKRFFTGNFIIKDRGKTKNKMKGRRPEGHITVPRSTRMKEKNRRQRRMEASSERGQGSEGAVAPYMGGYYMAHQFASCAEASDFISEVLVQRSAVTPTSLYFLEAFLSSPRKFTL
jgi:hypothetical protein